MNQTLEPHPIRRALGACLWVMFVAGAVYSGLLFFSTVRAFVARTTLPLVEQPVQVGVAPAAPVSEGGEVVQPAPPMDRVNILLLGIDQREQEEGPWRTDTMILVSIDPQTNTAAMLSIPRDLWVTIPGFGENRVNVAHFLGDSKDYPGGGPALAKKTVWYALGVPVHYYVRVNFTGFEKIVDAMGGLTINVEQPIHDAKYPDNNYGTYVLDIPAGIQQMDGKRALEYARTRHGSSDFDRMSRQQQVILAVRDKALSLDIPLSQLPVILQTLGDSVSTDIPLNEMLAMAELAKKVDRTNIRHGVIDESMTTGVTTATGAMVETPDWDKIRALVDSLFPTGESATVAPVAASAEQLATEAASILVQNGTTTADLAQTASAELRAQGLGVMRYENADRLDHAQTLLIAYADKPLTAQALATQLGVQPANILDRRGQASEFDLVVILGQEYTQRATQP